MEILRRAWALFLLSLHPGSAALDPLVPRSVGATIGAIVLVLTLLVVGAWAASRRAWPVVVASVVLCLGLALGAARFVGAQGPLGRGALLVTPALAWWLATTVQAVFASRLPPLLGRPIAAVAVAVVLTGLVGAAGWDRLATRDAQWRAVLAQSPGHELAATTVADSFEKQGNAADALGVIEACARANGAACSCVGRAVAASLSRGKVTAARAFFAGAAPACQAGAAGLEAELLAQEGKLTAAVAAAARAPKDDPHALYALGLARLAAGDHAAALDLGTRAEAAGGGTAARLLVGSAQLAAGDLPGALATFLRAKAADPASAVVVYHLGLVGDRQGKYRDARENYLAALRLDAGLAEARYALAVLTARNGALAEAKNHLEKFRALAPSDPRLPALEALVSGSPNAPGAAP